MESTTVCEISRNEDISSARRGFYRPELDILRFFCFLLVFIYHSATGRLAGDALGRSLPDLGSFGVPVFFILSSFFITELLIREREKTSAVHVTAFYVRRVLRIWPLYFFFIALCCVVGLTHLHGVEPIPGKMVAFSLLLAGNWYLILYGFPPNALIILWSLSVEEQFYLVWPWLARVGGPAGIRATAVLLIPASYLSIALLVHHGASDNVLWPNTLVQMQYFATGSLLALTLHRRRPISLLRTRAVLLLCTVCTWLGASLVCRLRQGDSQITIEHACWGYALVNLGAICLFLAFYGLEISSGWIARCLIYLGKVSYGLYTFHYLALEIVSGALHQAFPSMGRVPLTAPLALLLTLACAACSYHFLETPALRLKERFTFVGSRPI